MSTLLAWARVQSISKFILKTFLCVLSLKNTGFWMKINASLAQAEAKVGAVDKADQNSFAINGGNILNAIDPVL